MRPESVNSIPNVEELMEEKQSAVKLELQLEFM